MHYNEIGVIDMNISKYLLLGSTLLGLINPLVTFADNRPSSSSNENQNKTMKSTSSVVNRNILGLNVQISTNTQVSDGVNLKSNTGKVGDIDNVYAIVSYDRVEDINGKQIMNGAAIANGNIRSWVEDHIGEDARIVLTNDGETTGVYIVGLDRSVKLGKQDNKTTLLQATFSGNKRSKQITLPVDVSTDKDNGQINEGSFFMGINYSGYNIDINFSDYSYNNDEDKDDMDWNPGMIFSLPTYTKLNVNWVNQENSQPINKDLSKTINLKSGDTYTTTAQELEKYKYKGKLTTPLIAGNKIEDNDIDVSVNQNTKSVDYDYDESFLADYRINRYLGVGESYTSILQDYIYPTDNNLNGMMIYRPIDITVKRENVAGDITVNFKDLTTGENKSELIKHGYSATYSNVNDFWHYFEDNPGGPGYSIRTIHNNIQLDDPQDDNYVYNNASQKGADVTVKYVDENGKKIAPSEIKSGNIGDNYITEEKNISGYNFKEIKGNAHGKFTDKEQTVTYIYTKNIKEKAKVIVNYVDKTGKELAQQEILLGEAGKNYSTVRKSVKGYSMTGVVGSSTGKFTDDTQTVTYIYEKIFTNTPTRPIADGKLTVKYVDENGKDISASVVTTEKAGTEYKTEKKDIKGYTFKEVEGNENGKYTAYDQTVTYVYIKNNSTNPIKPDTPNDNNSNGSESNSGNTNVDGKDNEVIETITKNVETVLPKTAAQKMATIGVISAILASLTGLIVWKKRK